MASIKRHYSAMQKKLLLEFIEENPLLVKQKISNQYTNLDTRSKWEEISKKLNAIPGAQKTWKDWRKCWSDIKCRAKKKQAQNNKAMRVTGGGPSTYEYIDPIADRILQAMGGKTLIAGNEGIAEAGITIVNDSEDNELIENSPEDTSNTFIEQPLSLLEHETSCSAVSSIHQRNEESVVIETTEKSPQSKKKTVPPPKKTKGSGSAQSSKKTNLKASIEASNNLITISKEKNNIKRAYYQEKLKILREDLETKKLILISMRNIEEILLSYSNIMKVNENVQ